MKRIAFFLFLTALTATAWVRADSPRVAAPGGSLLEALPDGTAVALVDFQKVSGSSLWAAINAQDNLKGAIDKTQSEMADLGVRLSDIHTLALVFPAAGPKSPAVALAGGFEQNDLLTRLRANGKVKLTSEKYKDFDIYSAKAIPATAPSKETAGASAGAGRAGNPTKDETWFVFYDASSVVVGSLENVRASVDVKTGVRPGISKNVKLTDALAHNPEAAVRFAFEITPAMAGGLQSSNFPISEFSSVSLIFGSIDVASGIDLIATLRSDNVEHATAISERLNGLLAMARGFLGSTKDPKMASIGEALKTVSIVSADSDVRITGSLPTELLTSLISSSTKKGH